MLSRHYGWDWWTQLPTIQWPKRFGAILRDGRGKVSIDRESNLHCAGPPGWYTVISPLLGFSTHG
jgi:hypothetical protein